VEWSKKKRWGHKSSGGHDEPLLARGGGGAAVGGRSDGFWVGREGQQVVNSICCWKVKKEGTAQRLCSAEIERCGAKGKRRLYNHPEQNYGLGGENLKKGTGLKGNRKLSYILRKGGEKRAVRKVFKRGMNKKKRI